jgi:hypothetical protein
VGLQQREAAASGAKRGRQSRAAATRAARRTIIPIDPHCTESPICESTKKRRVKNLHPIALIAAGKRCSEI